MIFFQNVYGNQFTRNALEKDPKKKHVVINAEPKKSVRVLLLGTAEAGKSTILKQMKLLKLKGFNEIEINGFIATIRDNVVSAMRILLKSMATLDIPFADNERCEAVQNFIVLSNTLRNSPEDLDLEAMRLILDDFLQDQEQGKEKILIPWQTVIDHSKAMEHSQIRMPKLLKKLRTMDSNLVKIGGRTKWGDCWTLCCCS